MDLKDRQSTSSSYTRLKEFEAWSEQYSSAGRRYFYNRETEISQWEKPQEWRDYEKFLNENRGTQSPISSSSGIRGVAPVAQLPATQRVGSVQNSADDDSKSNRKRVREPSNAVTVRKQKTEIKEEENSQSQTVFNEEQHRRFIRPELVSYFRRWPAEELEQSAMKAGFAAHTVTIQLLYASRDLKSTSSLVKAAEMKSTLLARKLHFISQNQKQLESTLNAGSSMSFT